MQNQEKDAGTWGPERLRTVADTGMKWIREHPTEAFILGTVGGFAVGAVGIGRALLAARFLRSMPVVLPGIIAGVSALAQKVESKSDQERVTH